MKQLSKKNRILVGLTLFSMFFGAGNLIFPPFLGALAGGKTWSAMIGFIITAIGFPILGVVAVAKADGLSVLAGRVHSKFAFVFTLLIYLSIGPCLAIPRTASTSYEMAITPFLGDMIPTALAQVLYSAIFFIIAFIVAMKPEQLTQRLGKIMTPCLLVLICIIFVGCIVNPVGAYGTTTELYKSNPVVKGFLDGYQTMDTIAALNFGIIISLNIRAIGIKDDSVVVKETINAGIIAGGVLLLVYGALAHIGALAGGAFSNMENGANVMTTMVRFLFGKPGMIILAIIFFIACMNTCIGLLCCCSKYFCTIVPKVSYKQWVAIFAGASFVVSNVGLSKILAISVPVLSAIYPVAIVLIILSFIHPKVGTRDYVYQLSILLTGIASVVSALFQCGIKIPILTTGIQMLPFYEVGLGWIAPAVVGTLVGTCIHMYYKKTVKS
ncbi:MAG: branched-chain amino acid transport system II carrier protein [Lachnospiraceae bacterium]